MDPQKTHGELIENSQGTHSCRGLREDAKRTERGLTQGSQATRRGFAEERKTTLGGAPKDSQRTHRGRTEDWFRRGPSMLCSFSASFKRIRNQVYTTHNGRIAAQTWAHFVIEHACILRSQRCQGAPNNGSQAPTAEINMLMHTVPYVVNFYVSVES